MAHSRIIQIHYEPIDESDLITEYTFFDNGFLDNIGDYVNEETDKQSDIDCLLRYLGNEDFITYNKEDQTIIFKKGFKREFFRDKFDKFKEMSADIDLDTFSGYKYFTDNKTCLYGIESLIKEKYGLYIYEDYYMTLAEYIRELQEDTIYYIGATIDYHS